MSDFSKALNPNKPLLDQISVMASGQYMVVAHKGKYYPMKRVATPSSRFSTARWLRSTSPIVKNFKPKLEYDENVLGEVIYQVWNNTIVIPVNFGHSRRLV